MKAGTSFLWPSEQQFRSSDGRSPPAVKAGSVEYNRPMVARIVESLEAKAGKLTSLRDFTAGFSPLLVLLGGRLILIKVYAPQQQENFDVGLLLFLYLVSAALIGYLAAHRWLPRLLPGWITKSTAHQRRILVEEGYFAELTAARISDRYFKAKAELDRAWWLNEVGGPEFRDPQRRMTLLRRNYFRWCREAGSKADEPDLTGLSRRVLYIALGLVATLILISSISGSALDEMGFQPSPYWLLIILIWSPVVVLLQTSWLLHSIQLAGFYLALASLFRETYAETWDWHAFDPPWITAAMRAESPASILAQPPHV